MNTSLVEALVQAVLSLSADEQQRFEQMLAQNHTQELVRAQDTHPTKLNLENQPFVGLWADREDRQDSVQWVQNLRQQQWGTSVRS